MAKHFKKYGVKYVFDHHDICPELFEAKFGHTSGPLYFSQIFMERQTYKNCTFAFVTNESYRKIAIERGKMDPEKVIVLRSGPKLERMKIQPPVESIKRGKKYMVGYLGVIGQQEGIEYILEAAKYCKEVLNRNDIFWGIVGGGPHVAALKEQCTQMGLDDCVEFTGRVPDQQLLDYLNTAGALVESKMAGIAAIVSDWNFNAEIVKNDSEGIVLKEKLSNVLNKINSQKMMELKVGAFESRKRYDIETYREQLLEEI